MLAHVLFAMPLVFILTAFAEDNPFIGRWALDPESGGAACLEIERRDGLISGSLLWIGGSPEPFVRIFRDGDSLHGVRMVYDPANVAAIPHLILLTATLNNDVLSGTLLEPAPMGESAYRQSFTGQRMSPIPPRPDLATIQFGEPEVLFDGKSLNGWVVAGGAHWGVTGKDSTGKDSLGWIPTDEAVQSGWSVRDGVLRNNPVQQPSQPHIRYGNLVTESTFDDFKLMFETRVPEDGNSGVYLRGVYEIQIRDSYELPVDSHTMGALYGRITPAASAERPAGEWQQVEITLVKQHVTVVLNGATIIDNKSVAGCTGGALWSDVTRPGPIYLQGDHTAVEFRNMVVRRVKQ
ncbi:MAG: hypothetical protein AMXMBFR84_43630 [Candidatus Hydrogenedentota bacterium]